MHLPAAPADVVASVDALPALKNHLAKQARLALGEARLPRADDRDNGHLAVLLGVLGIAAVLYEAGVDGMNVVLWRNRLFALPGDEGVFEFERMRRGGYSRSYESWRSSSGLKR